LARRRGFLADRSQTQRSDEAGDGAGQREVGPQVSRRAGAGGDPRVDLGGLDREERGALDDRALDEVRTSADLRRERGADLLEELALSGPAIDPDDAAAVRAAL
jgi:hypothetical protein